MSFPSTFRFTICPWVTLMYFVCGVTTMVRSYEASAAAGSPYISPVVSAKAETLAAERVSAATAGRRSFTMRSIQEFLETDNAPDSKRAACAATLVPRPYRDPDRQITFLKYSGHRARRLARLARLDAADAEHSLSRRCQSLSGR